MSRILVVEDDAAILRGLADNLACESHDVLTATDGERACSIVPRNDSISSKGIAFARSDTPRYPR